MKSSNSSIKMVSRNFLICATFGFVLGYAFSKFPIVENAVGANSLKTYTTKGVLISTDGGKVVLKDKFGQDWEYASAGSVAVGKGKNAKVTYTMQMVKVEAEQ